MYIISKMHHSRVCHAGMRSVCTRQANIEKNVALEKLKQLNQYTLELYNRRKLEMKKKLGKEIPVILHNQDCLSTLYRGERRNVLYVPEKYHVPLKAIAHIPMAIDTIRVGQWAEESDRLLSYLEGLFSHYPPNSNPRTISTSSAALSQAA